MSVMDGPNEGLTPDEMLEDFMARVAGGEWDQTSFGHWTYDHDSSTLEFQGRPGASGISPDPFRWKLTREVDWDRRASEAAAIMGRPRRWTQGELDDKAGNHLGQIR